MSNIKRMQIPKSFENSINNLLNRQQAQILSSLLIKMIISIDTNMHITYSIRQEVGDNIQEVFLILLPSQKMTLELNNICTSIRPFYLLKCRHFPLLVLSVVK